jgi:hypothetical protein
MPHDFDAAASVIGRMIAARLTSAEAELRARWPSPVRHFFIGDYYFSSEAPCDHEYRNVTSFRGRPEEFFKRIVLRAGAAALNTLGSAQPFLIRHNRHRR